MRLSLGSDEAPPAVVAGINALRACLSTAPRYPPGHTRVDDVLNRLRTALRSLDEGLEVEVRAQGGLHVCGRPASAKAYPGLASLSTLFSATGIRRVVFDRSTPNETVLTFARLLASNATRARKGGVDANDLWTDSLPGMVLETQVVHRDGFGAADGDEGADEGGGDGADGEVPQSRRSELRRLARRNLEVQSLLTRIGLLMQQRRGATTDGVDLLDRILKFLPLELRMDPARAVEAVQHILARFSSLLQSPPTGDGEQRVLTQLAKTVSSFFARIEDPVTPSDKRSAAAAPRTDEALASPEEMQREIRNALTEPILPIQGDTGIRDVGAVLLHALLAEREVARREALCHQLSQHLHDPLGRQDARCLESHLLALAATGGEDPNLQMLISLALDTGRHEALRSSGVLSVARVARSFPELLRGYCLVGRGSPGAVCRMVGWSRVVGAADALTGPGGLLSDGEGLDCVLSERGVNVLPLVAVHLGTPDADVRRVVRFLRTLDLRTRASAVVRLLPPERLPPELVSLVCVDEFDEVDRGRADTAAVAALARYLAEPGVALEEREFAVRALAGFSPRLAMPVLAWLRRRRFLVIPVEPRAIRRRALQVELELGVEGTAGAPS